MKASSPKNSYVEQPLAQTQQEVEQWMQSWKKSAPASPPPSKVSLPLGRSHEQASIAQAEPPTPPNPAAVKPLQPVASKPQAYPDPQQATPPLHPSHTAPSAPDVWSLKALRQQLAGQAAVINRLALEQEKALLNLNAIALKLSQKGACPPSHWVEINDPALMNAIETEDGQIIVTTLPVNWSRNAEDACQVAAQLRRSPQKSSVLPEPAKLNVNFGAQATQNRNAAPVARSPLPRLQWLKSFWRDSLALPRKLWIHFVRSRHSGVSSPASPNGEKSDSRMVQGQRKSRHHLGNPQKRRNQRPKRQVTRAPRPFPLQSAAMFILASAIVRYTLGTVFGAVTSNLLLTGIFIVAIIAMSGYKAKQRPIFAQQRAVHLGSILLGILLGGQL